MNDLSDRLSKSRFMKGLRCPLALYLSVHSRELADEPTPEQQARFDIGHRVGEIAQMRFPDGVLIAEDHLHHREAVESTRVALEAGAEAIFEAAFTYDNVKVRVDVLRRLEEGGFELIEVKSTSKYDASKHLADAAVQTYVLLGNGIDVRRVSLMHLDRHYVYSGGEYDPHALLCAADITTEALAFIRDVPGHIAEMMQVLALPEPPLPPAGVACSKPYACEFVGWCTRDVPAPDLSGTLVTEPAVLRRLDALPFPLHFVDFETVNPGLPLFPGSSPFQVMKVQWSVHTLHEDGRLEHAEYLATNSSSDPGPEFATALLGALGAEGTFVHYSPYERTALIDLAVHFEHLRQPIVDRIPEFYGHLLKKLAENGLPAGKLRKPSSGGLVAFDLGMRVVRDGCGHPVLGLGGWSIKKATALLAPHLPPYSGLVVSNGDQAMLAITEMLDRATPADRVAEIRCDLLEYCKQDTLAMVEIYRSLLLLRDRVA